MEFDSPGRSNFRWISVTVAQLSPKQLVGVQIPHPSPNNNASVVELADTLDLGSSAERLGGSTPLTRTKQWVYSIAAITFGSYPIRPGFESSWTHQFRCNKVQG